MPLSHLEVQIASVVELGEVLVELLGWSTGQVDVILDGVDADAADPADEPSEVPLVSVCRLGEFWKLGKHRLF